MISPPITPPTLAPHPLLINTSATYEDLAAWRAIWLKRHPLEIARLIGSREWIDQQKDRARRDGRRYVPIKALREAYRTVETVEIRQVSAKTDTLYGKEIDARFINYLELTLALQQLPCFAQDCWILSYEGMTYPEMATTLSRSEETVRKGVSDAGRRLMERIFEQTVITIVI